MINRRRFIKRTGAVTLGSMAGLEALKYCTPAGPAGFADNIGIQTFTTSTFIGPDVEAVFRQIAEIGFRNIETASYAEPYYGYTPAELKSMIEGLGMKWISHHVLGVPISVLMAQQETAQDNRLADTIPNLAENMQQLVDEAAEAGLQYLVCATTAIRTIDEINKAVEVFSRAGEACRKAGIQFAYHNHATEWDTVDGTTAYDVILSLTDEDLVKMELDLGWVATAGKDPVELFKGNPGRFPLWHLKDFNLETDEMKPLGEGTVDFRPAFAEAELAGMKYFFYEQDNAGSMEEVKRSYDNLKAILAKD